MAKEKPPENWDGLERKKVKGLDNVYVRPNVQFTPYKSVMLDPTQVEFSKNWEKSFDFSDRPNAAEMQKIRDNVAALMRERFTEGTGGQRLHRGRRGGRRHAAGQDRHHRSVRHRPGPAGPGYHQVLYVERGRR